MSFNDGLPKVSILLVENNAPEASRVERLLQDAGVPSFEWKRVETIDEALFALEKSPLDLVLLDLNLSESVDPSTIQQFVSHGHRIPVVAFSDDEDPARALEAISEGAQDYLIKSKLDGTEIIRSICSVIERVRVERSLHESEARYRAVAETAFTGIAITDSDERFTYVNTAFAEMLSYKPTELVGSSLREHTDIEGYESVREQTEKRERDVQNQYELTMYDKHGQARELLVSASPLFREGAQFEGTLAVIVDITDRKRHQKALRRTTRDLALLNEINHAAHQGASLKEVLRALSAGIRENYECDAAMIYLVDEACRDLLLQPETVPKIFREKLEESVEGDVPEMRFNFDRNQTLKDILVEAEPVIIEGAESDQLTVGEILDSHAKSDVKSFTKGQFVQEDTPHSNISSTALAPLLAEGSPVGMLQITRRKPFSEEEIGRLRTVTGQLAAILSQRRSSDKLRRLKEFNESIVLSMAEGIVVEDADGFISFANPAACELIGYSAEELVGQHWTIIIPEGQHSIVSDANTRRLQGRSDSYELKLKSKDGGFFDVLVSGSPLFEDGEFMGTLAVCTDITEQKTSEAILEKRTREISLLYDAGRKLNSSLDLHHVYETLHGLVSETMPCDGLFISSFDDGRDLIRCEMAFQDGQLHDVGEFPTIPLEPEGIGTQSQVIRSGTSMLAGDYQSLVHTSQTSFLVSEEGIVDEAPDSELDIARSAMIVPMTLENRVVGVIQCFSYAQNAYTEADLRILEALAAHVAAARANAELYYQTERELQERWQAEKAMKESEARLRSVVTTAPVIIFTLDRHGVFTLSEGRGLAALNLEPGEVVGKSVFEVYGEEPEILEAVRRALNGEENSNTVEVASLTFDTRYTPLRNDKGEVEGILGVATDVTERVRAEEQLRHDALHDSLTGLPNRSLFLDRLQRSLNRRKREKKYLFALLYLDLDRFKNVNDSLGHTRGDQLLIETARRLELCLRPMDTVARFGGDEFAILLDDIGDVSDALRVAARLQEELTLPFNLSGYEVFTSTSIGIALSETGYENVKDMLRDADIAMYRAKDQGKAQHVVFDQDMHERAVARLQLETDLRRAVERDSFEVYYQPIISIKTGAILGLEALVRWAHPDRGLISPARFIQVAEETGLIVPIDRFVMRRACRQVMIWNKAVGENASFYISVNLSRRSLSRPDFILEVDRVLQETGISPQDLYLEITESGIMQDTAGSMSTLLELRARGVQSLIDDFGTGHSSLSILQNLPIDGLKVDRSFIMDMEQKKENREIVKTIVLLAENLGKHSIAEGVESRDQVGILKKLGCEFAQGYLFHKPLPAEKVLSVLERSDPARVTQPYP